MKGVRQVGKTHLLKEFGHLHFPQFHYLNFEKNPKLAKIFGLAQILSRGDRMKNKRKDAKSQRRKKFNINIPLASLR